MFYIVYKVINRTNSKEYIGKHQTHNIDDGYMGSGKLLKRAIKKYGIENFDKKVLFVFDNEKEMNTKEKELVTEEHCNNKNNYNICPGGNGGFGYINNNKLNNSKHDISKKMSKLAKKVWSDPKYRKVHSKKVGNSIKQAHADGKIRYDTFTGRCHSEETKRKMSISSKGKNSGENNGQYGTCWINNGIENKKVKREELINWLSIGWIKGRKMKLVSKGEGTYELGT
tara:strand:- start:1411 stop:2091 length:681 start_codon:yes stop_codon:yes gene_type:complete